jgi:hypothetical protein
LNSVQIPAKANSGRSSFSANQTTSFFLVSGLGSGAYSEKLLAGTRHRFSGFNQARQCGDEVFRILVTGGRRTSEEGASPAHHGQLPFGAGVAHDGSGIVRKHTRLRRQVADDRFSTRKSAMIAAWFVAML